MQSPTSKGAPPSHDLSIVSLGFPQPGTWKMFWNYSTIILVCCREMELCHNRTEGAPGPCSWNYQGPQLGHVLLLCYGPSPMVSAPYHETYLARNCKWQRCTWRQSSRGPMQRRQNPTSNPAKMSSWSLSSSQGGILYSGPSQPCNCWFSWHGFDKGQ